MAKKPSNSVARAVYTGTLNEPIVSRKINEERIYGAWDAKLELLLDHYGIEFKEPECWLTLALCLASDHVPGFEIVSAPKRGPGAPKKWIVSKAQRLVEAVDAIALERERGIRDAIRTLASRHPKVWPAKTKEEVSCLATRYYECKKRVLRIRKFVGSGSLFWPGGAHE